MADQRAPGIQDTITNKLALIDSLLPFCSCGLHQKISFVCKEVNCIKHQLQPYYCLDCMEKYHMHPQKNITTYFDEYEKKWETLFFDIMKAKEKLDEWKSRMNEVIDLVIKKNGRTPHIFLQQWGDFENLILIFLLEKEEKGRAKMENNFDQYVQTLIKIEELQNKFDRLDQIQHGINDQTLNLAFKQNLLDLELQDILSFRSAESIYKVMKFQLNNRLESLLGDIDCDGIQSFESFSRDIDRINGFLLVNIDKFDLHQAHLLRFDMLDYKMQFKLKLQASEMDPLKLRILHVFYRKQGFPNPQEYI
ncbi:hypothetical protein FGO68_gene13584 [Halteria grandinella]|uniref:Uncharacterized protein n=1 Tax=Halteria grandinella TaxID=5974 RepID=A0A8J8T052_HALGN|nr:hypothetical protein FGO68_gene13584 [Halteria grandinella]